MTPQLTTREIQSLLDKFVEACIAVFGEARIEAIIVHGSAVKGGAIRGYSDLDFQVYLRPDCFAADGHMLDDLAFAIQERIGPLPWEQAGVSYPQAYFHDRHRMPSSWVGPAPGSYRELLGQLPCEVKPTADLYRQAARRLLDGLPARIRSSLESFADSSDAMLPRRLRLLGTDIAPTLFALLTEEADDPLALWAMPKTAALEQLKARHPTAAGPVAAATFYSNVGRLFGARFDVVVARRTFREGIVFLRWAEIISRHKEA